MKVYMVDGPYKVFVTCTCMKCKAEYPASTPEVMRGPGLVEDIGVYRTPCPKCGEAERVMTVGTPEPRQGPSPWAGKTGIESWH